MTISPRTPLDDPNQAANVAPGEHSPCSDAAACEASESGCLEGAGQGDDACPIPLSVVQVLQAFRDESEPWKLDRDGYSIEGRSWGTGPTLLFLNGLAGSSELYALAGFVLQKQFRCLFYDYPATDGAIPLPLRTSVNAWADDAIAVARQFGDSPVHLFASSLGTSIALTAMSEQPSLFGKAVLYGAVTNQHFNFSERMCLRLMRGCRFPLKHLPFRRIFQSNNHLPWFPGYDRPRWQLYLENTGQTRAAHIARRAQLLTTFDLATVPQVQSPVLLLGGEGEGPTAAKSRQYLEQHLPQSSASYMHTAGQVPFFTHPHRVAKIVNEFLEPSLADPAE